MQNQNAKINFDDKACIQDSKINRLHTGKSSRRIKECPPLEKVEKDIHLVKETHVSKKNMQKSHNPKISGSSFLKKIMDFLKSDDALLVFVFVLLIQDGVDDEVLLGLIIYLFLSDKFDLSGLTSLIRP